MTPGTRILITLRKVPTWKWILGLVFVGVLAKHFVNKPVDSKTPTMQSGVQDVFDQLASDGQKLNELCMTIPKMETAEQALSYVKQCRAQTLAARPVLGDMHLRFQQFKAAWEKETMERNVPNDCRNGVQQVMTVFQHYLAGEDQDFEFWGSMNLDSATRKELANAMRHAAALDRQGAEVISQDRKAFDEKSINEACRGWIQVTESW